MDFRREVSEDSLALSELRCIASGVGYYFTMWRNAYILDFYETPTVEGLDASIACKRIVLRKNPAGVIVLNLVDGENPPPSGPIRRYAQTKSTEDPAGVLIRGEGFKPATIRSMLATIQLVTRAPYPRKVFATNDEAASWAAPLAGAPLAKHLLAEALVRTREKEAAA